MAAVGSFPRLGSVRLAKTLLFFFGFFGLRRVGEEGRARKERTAFVHGDMIYPRRAGSMRGGCKSLIR